MENIELRISEAVRAYKRETCQTTADLSKKLGISASAMSAKLQGERPYKIHELVALAQLGVDLPSFREVMESA